MMTVDPWFPNEIERTAWAVQGRAVLGIRELPDLGLGMVDALN